LVEGQCRANFQQDAIGDLTELLKHKDPNVRTLALAALFQRQDPKLFPHFAAMTRDDGRTMPRVQSWGGLPPPKPVMEAQTVGDVATAFVEFWLNPVVKEATTFEAYWGPRKDRKFCASWFLVRMQRATQFSSHLDKEMEPLIRKVRKEIDALPEVDRDWTLIWLAAHRDFLSNQPANVLTSPDERITAGKRLGPARLMDMIHNKTISDDPDLSPGAGGTGRDTGRDFLIHWIVRNARKLLRPEDAPALLKEEARFRDVHIVHGFAIGAAELQPKNASKWLRKSLSDRKVNGHASQGYGAELASALWRVVGESEIDFLADWFYGLRADNNFFPGYATLFLRDIKGVRAPADRKLLARLIDDPRFDMLDYQSVSGLIVVVNGWTKMPVISHRDLNPNWDGGWGPKSERDEAIVAQWRTKLKKSQAEWNK
jgi:hypothetical protein